MGQLTNQYVSSSYQGLLKMTDSTQGLTNTLQTIQTGDGDNSPLQMSFTEVNISGSFFINNVPITNGTNGTSGTSGTSGSNGSDGTSGTSGSNGSSGSSGSNGSSGTSGSSGSSGTSGGTGSSGTSGAAGSSGTSGTSGGAGATGSSGTSGTSGTSGVDGTSGTSGTSGTGFENPYTGDIIVTGSIDITGQYLVNGVPVSGSGGGGDRNGLITTGSLGTEQSITGALDILGGDLMFINTGTTLPFNYTSSIPGTTNVLFGWNNTTPSIVQTGSILISGSNNILLNKPNDPNDGSTFTGYGTFISGSGNIFNGPFGGISFKSGSAARPQAINNIGAGTAFIQLTSSSLAQPGVFNNIMMGNVNMNHQSGSFNLTTNTIISTLTSNQNNITATQRPVIGGNIVNNFLTLNHISSSIQTNNNIFNSQASQINNHFSSSLNTAGNARIDVLRNITNGFGNNIYVSGSGASNNVRQFTDNLIGGRSNIVSSSYVGTNSAGVVSTIMYGESLNISGSNTTTGGSAFFGRFNATGSLQESTAETVFVVGTGTNAGNRRNALRIDNNNNSNFTGSVNISGSLIVNGSSVLAGTTGLITTGSVGTTQFITGGLNVNGNINVTGAFNTTNVVATGVSNFQDNVNITGTTTITGSLILNGTTITPSDRNGLITTGSVFSSQNITGSLTVSGSNVTITGTDTNNSSNTFVIVSGSMKMGDPSGSLRIATANNQPQLFFNPTRKVGFFLGQSNMDQVNTQFGITDDSTDNYTMGGNFNNFRTGSNNLMLGVQSISLRSGSNNIILAHDTNYNTGSNNLMLGRGPFSVNEVNEYFNLQLPNSNDPIMFKSGSAGPLTISGSLLVSNGATITGSLSVSSLSNATGSFVVTTDSTGTLTKSPYSAVTSNLFSVGDFYSTQTQTLAAGVSGSVTYNNTGTTFGVTLVSSSQLTIANAGVYSITFSAQIKGDGGQDTVYMWLKKNGTNVADTATKLVAKNNEEDVMTVEYIVQAAASDYYEIAWQNVNGDGDLLYEAASGNIPAVPSIITSVKQIR